MRRLAVAFAVLSAAALPAQAGMFDDDEARARIEALRRQVEADRRVLDERFAKIESGLIDRRTIIDLAGQLDALRGEIARMRGQLEVLANQAETAEKRQKDLYVDIDARLRKLEQAKEEQAKPSDKPGEQQATPAETRAYEAALNQFKLGNYPLAISAFQGFLVTYPTSSLAPSAQYWVGNSHYALRDYKQAVAAQQKLIAAWPDNPKAADAMLNIASSQDAMGDRRSAQRTLEGLVTSYPGSPAAETAKQRLSAPARR